MHQNVGVTVSRTATLAQVGYTTGGVWNTTTDPMAVTSAGNCGMKFTLPTRGNQTAYSYSGMSLTLTTGIAGLSGTATASVTFPSSPEQWNNWSPADWSTANPPASASVRAVGTATLPSTTDTSFTINLDIAIMGAVYRRSGWNGGLYLTLATSSGSRIKRACSLVATGEVPTEGAISGHIDANSGVQRCNRCIRILPREQMIQDGYLSGMLVCPECWEPEEEFPKNRPHEQPERTRGPRT